MKTALAIVALCFGLVAVSHARLLTQLEVSTMLNGFNAGRATLKK